MSKGPVVIHQSFSTFGDAEYSVDPRVVKRIRTDYDPLFCPLFRLQVWKWEDGHTKKFKNFGVGASALEDIPVVGPIYTAMRPDSGYLSKIEPAKDVVVWWPFEQSMDGTPGDTVPFDDRIYYLVKRTFERTRELEYKAKQIAKTQALTFSREFMKQEQTEADKAFDFEKKEAGYRLKQEIPTIRKAVENTTQEDVEKLYDKANRAPKPFIHMTGAK